MREVRAASGRAGGRFVRAWAVLALVAGALGEPAPGWACPFCGSVGRSLAERRDAAAVVMAGEALGAAAVDVDGLPVQRFALLGAVRGPRGTEREVTARITAPVAGTAILFGSRLADRPTVGAWEAVAADESLLAHVAAAPAVADPPAQRLRWFAARLEHPHPAIAEDAFVEFGLAPFAAVRAAAAVFDTRSLRDWVGAPAIDPRRKGFYGLALGLAATAARDPAEAALCRAALREAIAAPAADLRAGFDGLVAGLLVAEGVGGLALLEERGLLGSDTRPGDARHVLAALRFAAESLGDSLPADRVAAATARLLANPTVAAAATVDLARYRAWDPLEQVAGLWDTLGHEDPLVRRAVAGYLAACPFPAARERLAEIRARAPERLREALEAAGPR